MDGFPEIMKEMPASTLQVTKEVFNKKKDMKGIQKWINSISSDEDRQEIINKGEGDADRFNKNIPEKKPCSKDDLVLGDEAISSNLKDSGPCKNIFQQLMRKKFSEGVTGGSFNSDATSDRQQSAELILRNLGFCVPPRCEEANRVIPERFFKEPSVANGICSAVSEVKMPNPSIEQSKVTMADAVNRIMRLISTDKSVNKNGDNNGNCSGGDEDDNDEIDGPNEESEKNFSDQNILVDTIKELFLSKINAIDACPTGAPGTPQGGLGGGFQAVRPSLKVSQAGTRYWTILQPDNSEYLDSIGYYDTMPSVSEPYQNLQIHEQFTNALSRLQQLGKKKKHFGKPNVISNDETAMVMNLNVSSNPMESQDSVDVDEMEINGDGRDDDDESQFPCKKIMMTLPPRFLQTPSLLGNLPQFAPDSSTPQKGLTAMAEKDSSSLESRVHQHHHHALHRQSSVFSDLLKEFQDDDNNIDHHHHGDIMFRFSDSSYSCGDSSCSSLPRDIELERYYASKNMLRIPTAESDEAASCISDHTAVNENVARIPSASEGAEGGQPAEKTDNVLPDLSDLKKKLKARMSRQTSSQSDSSGFGDSEFVDALTHQQIHSTTRSSGVGSSLRLSDIGRSATFDLGTACSISSEKVSQNQDIQLQSLGALCHSCSGARDVLRLETWSQTSLSFCKLDDRCTSTGVDSLLRSELTIDNGGDSALSTAPFGSEVCLFLRDETSQPRTSTTLNFRLSRLPFPERGHSYDAEDWQPRNTEGCDQHLSYQLLSDNTERRQSQPLLNSHLDSHKLLSRLNHYTTPHSKPCCCIRTDENLCSSLQQLCHLKVVEDGLSQCPGSNRQIMMEQASQLLCTAHTYQEEVKLMQTNSLDDPLLSNVPLLYEEVLKQIDGIHRHLLEWCRKSLTNEMGDGNEELKELKDLSSQLDAIENVIRAMRVSCHIKSNKRVTAPSLTSMPLTDVNVPLNTWIASSPYSSVCKQQKSSFLPSSKENTHSKLETIEHKLSIMEEKLAFQQEHQELTLRLILREFKDSLIEEFKEMKNNSS